MAYEYDIFISYKRKYRSWIQEVFLPSLEFYLEESVSERLRTFIDVSDINVGDDWSERIYTALAKSKCMIAFWSPSYFKSTWCLKEFAAMLHRQNQIKATPQGLILPFNMNDGDSFHPEAKKLNYFDCRPFVSRHPKSLLSSSKVLVFEEQLKTWVPKIAKVINNAPKFDPAWNTTDWLEEPFNNLPPNTSNLPKNPTKLWGS